jgi:hypothetical protein
MHSMTHILSTLKKRHKRNISAMVSDITSMADKWYLIGHISGAFRGYTIALHLQPREEDAGYKARAILYNWLRQTDKMVQQKKMDHVIATCKECKPLLAGKEERLFMEVETVVNKMIVRRLVAQGRS